MAAKGKVSASDFLPILDDLIVEFCRRLRSSRKAITPADLTKLLEVRTKLGGPVSQNSSLWQMIEKIRQEQAPQSDQSTSAKSMKASSRTRTTGRESNEK